MPFHEIGLLQNIFLSLRCHLVKFLRQEAHKHASLHDTSTSKQFITSSTIFSTTVCQRDEDLQQQTLHFFWEAIGTSTVTFKGLYLALLSFIKFPATTRAVHFNAHAYFFKYSSDRWKRWSSSLSCPPEMLVPFPLPGFFLKNVAHCFSFVSLNSLKDRVFLPLVSSCTFISLLFASSFPQLGQNLNEACKDSPHVEQNMTSKEGEGAA